LCVVVVAADAVGDKPLLLGMKATVERMAAMRRCTPPPPSSHAHKIDVSFEHFNPQQQDFWAIKQLLQSYADGIDIDLTALADLIIAQGHEVGTVLKVANDASGYGLITVLNLSRHGVPTPPPVF
jgi:hypothetical protein